MTPNIAHQSGHARAYIKQDWAAYSGPQLFVTLGEDTTVVFDKGTLLLRTVQGGTTPAPDEIALTWAEPLTDTIVDIFKAIGKALDIYSDEPSQAFKQGFAEGEAKVLREWNEDLRNHGVTVKLPPKSESEPYPLPSVDAWKEYADTSEQGTLFPKVYQPTPMPVPSTLTKAGV